MQYTINVAKLPAPLSFDWDGGNLEKNWQKHKVHFKEAEEIFLNRPLKLFEDPKHSIKEERFLAYGITNQGRKLTVVFTVRKQKVRPISTRDMNKKEVTVYEKS